jgi:Cu(I)-responsive transcriptional regulator
MARYVARPELAEARELGFYNIGEASAATGVSAKMIRQYESAGIIPKPGRTFAGYRLYADADLDRLRFIRKSRSLGFPIAQIEKLLTLMDNNDRTSAQVKQLAQAHADDLAIRIGQMQSMHSTLTRLAKSCKGDHTPDCPILHNLAHREN